MIRPTKRLLRKRRNSPGISRANPGSAPGVLQHNPDHLPSSLSLVAFGPDGFVEQHDVKELRDVERLVQQWPIVWVHVTGLGNIELLEHLGNMFALDRLSLEDVLDTSHRPKVEFYESYVFTIVKGATLAEQFESEQISLFLKKNVVISFQERPNHNFEQVRDRIRRGTGKIRFSGADYLYYAILDEVIDRYFPILDQVNHQLTAIEDKIFSSRSEKKQVGETDVIQQIHNAKNDLLLLHRTVWPISDIVGMLMREDSALTTKSTRNFFKDCYDHSVQANELSQFYRDTATGLLNTYLAYEGHKTNEVVKVLTMVSAIFIPLNLIASIYGMNFNIMYPSHDGEYNFVWVMITMLAVGFAMMLVFNRMGWLPRLWPLRTRD
jgi:magnesium transporter